MTADDGLFWTVCDHVVTTAGTCLTHLGCVRMDADPPSIVCHCGASAQSYCRSCGEGCCRDHSQEGQYSTYSAYDGKGEIVTYRNCSQCIIEGRRVGDAVRAGARTIINLFVALAEGGEQIEVDGNDLKVWVIETHHDRNSSSGIAGSWTSVYLGSDGCQYDLRVVSTKGRFGRRSTRTIASLTSSPLTDEELAAAVKRRARDLGVALPANGVTRADVIAEFRANRTAHGTVLATSTDP